ncbi:peptide/nickel transport system permease protein [Frondihabitans sp. PhB188]|uniref:dipeptide/oligopeptide/nickel ABC transporter permease/ATP-binding protein n=1 Tax=Frondihabitans sp. PhB188 TaxID=2485200 RepID=UPI000F4ACA21|nr:dipeptide/oligopeptide/nickel ABC transporter permease/ATP-binding protein [Frondihabitans sp. PhB188]ROQ39396.1 peptide/nickel transport system permease protein [Frondihabitans sp. PhB188]
MTTLVTEKPVPLRKKNARKIRPATILASGWLIIVVIATLLAPVLAPQGADVQSLSAQLQGTTGKHLLGTDELGRDLLVRLLYGAQPTLLAVVIVVVITIGLGGIAGLIAGYLRGRLDGAVSAVFDVLQSVPPVLISLVVFAIFPYNLFVVIAATSVFLSPFIYRVIRGATLSLGGELYVTSARATGLSHPAIIWRHLTPRLAGLIRVQASMIAAVAITTEVGLGFLGLDVAPPNASWGGLLADGTQYLAPDPWMIFPPLIAIALTIVSFGTLGEVAQKTAKIRRRLRSRLSSAPARLRTQLQESTEPLLTEDPQSLGAANLLQTAQDVLLSVRGLTVRTRGDNSVALVDDVNFDLLRGEVLGIVGESGAGKSVIVRSLMRASNSTLVEGHAHLDGTDLVTATEQVMATMRGRRIAYIGQDPLSALDPLFRIGNQLIEAVRNHRTMSKQDAYKEGLRLLDAVKIPSPEDVMRKYSFEISGGQAQRVAIALALAGDPDLLIADEPTTALDVTIQMEVLGLLKDLQRERALSIILVTHDWGVVADMCDRVLTVYAGEIVEAGSIRNVFRHPAHPYTAALRAADPHLQTQGSRLMVIPGRMPAAMERPDGCRFADRCPLAIEICRTHPALMTISERPDAEPHASRCFRASDVEEIEEVPAHV